MDQDCTFFPVGQPSHIMFHKMLILYMVSTGFYLLVHAVMSSVLRFSLNFIKISWIKLGENEILINSVRILNEFLFQSNFNTYKDIPLVLFSLARIIKLCQISWFIINSIALRKTKNGYNFGLSDCNRVKKIEN